MCRLGGDWLMWAGFSWVSPVKLQCLGWLAFHCRSRLDGFHMPLILPGAIQLQLAGLVLLMAIAGEQDGHQKNSCLGFGLSLPSSATDESKSDSRAQH